jgi:hypothetical protein
VRHSTIFTSPSLQFVGAADRSFGFEEHAADTNNGEKLSALFFAVKTPQRNL